MADYAIFEERDSQGLAQPVGGFGDGGISVPAPFRREIEMDDPPPPPPPPVGSRTQGGTGIGVLVTESRSIDMDDPPPPPPPPVGSRTQGGTGIGVLVTESRSIDMDDPPPPPPPPVGSRTQMGTGLALSSHPDTYPLEVLDTNNLNLNHSHWSQQQAPESAAMITRWVEDSYGNFFALESRWIGPKNDSETFDGTTDRALYLSKLGEAESWQVYLGADRGQDVRLVLDEFENLVVAGEFSGSLTLGEATLESLGWTDLFVARIDSSGHPIWVRHLGSGGEDRVVAMFMDEDGDFTVRGNTRFAKNLGAGLFVKSPSRDFSARYLETGELDHLETN